MKIRRLELNSLFLEHCKNVYFQSPPPSGMTYPCIKYEQSGETNKHANDKVYLSSQKYTVTFISKDPDSTLHEFIKDMPYASFDRICKADNLYHWVYDLYY